MYYHDDGWIAEMCDMKGAFLHPNMEVEVYIEWPKGVVDLGIIIKEFLE